MNKAESNIFISYSHEDSDFMLRLREDLSAHGFQVWVDDKSLVPGTPSWENAIERGIVQSKYVIVILSPEAKNSLWVTREIAVAEGATKEIIPILIRGNESSAVPFRLISTQRVDARNNYSEALKILLSALPHEGEVFAGQSEKRKISQKIKWILVPLVLIIIAIISTILLINSDLEFVSSAFGRRETPTITPVPFYTTGLMTYVVGDDQASQLFALDHNGVSHLLTDRFHEFAGISESHDHLALIVESGSSKDEYDLIIVTPFGELVQNVVSGADEIHAYYLSENELLVTILDGLTVKYRKYQVGQANYELEFVSENNQWEEVAPTEVAPTVVVEE